MGHGWRGGPSHCNAVSLQPRLSGFPGMSRKQRQEKKRSTPVQRPFFLLFLDVYTLRGPLHTVCQACTCVCVCVCAHVTQLECTLRLMLAQRSSPGNSLNNAATLKRGPRRWHCRKARSTEAVSESKRETTLRRWGSQSAPNWV